jgi:hypothetical protein
MKPDINPLRVLVKALCLFVVINSSYPLFGSGLAGVSAYNSVFPGRTRLPFGGDSFSVMVDSIDPMFASHLISAPKPGDEFRVVLLGDSSIWGENLGAYEVISEQWNRLNMQCGNRVIRAYNLGYPHPSVIKDLVILEKALEYEPDLIVWFVTLNTLNPRQANPFLIANRERTINLLNTYEIAFQANERLSQVEPTFFSRTLIGQRSALARQIKLQLLGVIWMATGADSDRLAEEPPPDFNVGDDPRYRGMDPSADITSLLLFSALEAGIELAHPAPVLLVNEPIFVAEEKDATVRYDAMYPRWVYDQYRAALTEQAQIRAWSYLDLWDVIPREYFSDAGVHRTARSEPLLIQQLNPTIQSIACNPKP